MRLTTPSSSPLSGKVTWTKGVWRVSRQRHTSRTSGAAAWKVLRVRSLALVSLSDGLWLWPQAHCVCAAGRPLSSFFFSLFQHRFLHELTVVASFSTPSPSLSSPEVGESGRTAEPDASCALPLQKEAHPHVSTHSAEHGKRVAAPTGSRQQGLQELLWRRRRPPAATRPLQRCTETDVRLLLVSTSAALSCF